MVGYMVRHNDLLSCDVWLSGYKGCEKVHNEVRGDAGYVPVH